MVNEPSVFELLRYDWSRLNKEILGYFGCTTCMYSTFAYGLQTLHTSCVSFGLHLDAFILLFLCFYGRKIIFSFCI